MCDCDCVSGPARSFDTGSVFLITFEAFFGANVSFVESAVDSSLLAVRGLVPFVRRGGEARLLTGWTVATRAMTGSLASGAVSKSSQQDSKA